LFKNFAVSGDIEMHGPPSDQRQTQGRDKNAHDHQYFDRLNNRVDESVPKVVWFTSAATNDHILLEKLELSPDKIYVFDKGYNDYQAFKKFTDNETGFVTRIKDNAVYKTLEKNEIEDRIHSGVIEDVNL
jgi:hypothetical protein